MRTSQRRRKERIAAGSAVASFLLVCLGIVPMSARAQAKPSEYSVKAAYLLNFGRFVRWPDKTSGGFQICVLGADPFGKALEATVAGESIDGSPIVATHISRVSEADGCRVLFISDSEKSRIPAILSALRGHHVLTVSDVPGFVESGGDIGFILQRDRVRFSINLNAAQESGLAVSSDLLRVAVSVINAKG